MNAEFIFRLFGMVIMAIVGGIWGQRLGSIINVNPSPDAMPIEQFRFLFGLLGALIGLILTPYFTTRPAKAIRNGLAKATPQGLLAYFPFPFRYCPTPLAAFCLSLWQCFLLTLESRFFDCDRLISLASFLTLG